MTDAEKFTWDNLAWWEAYRDATFEEKHQARIEFAKRVQAYGQGLMDVAYGRTGKGQQGD